MPLEQGLAGVPFFLCRMVSIEPLGRCDDRYLVTPGVLCILFQQLDRWLARYFGKCFSGLLPEYVRFCWNATPALVCSFLFNLANLAAGSGLVPPDINKKIRGGFYGIAGPAQFGDDGFSHKTSSIGFRVRACIALARYAGPVILTRSLPDVKRQIPREHLSVFRRDHAFDVT